MVGRPVLPGVVEVVTVVVVPGPVPCGAPGPVGGVQLPWHGGGMWQSLPWHGGGMWQSRSWHGGGVWQFQPWHGGGMWQSQPWHGGGMWQSQPWHGVQSRSWQDG